MEERQHPEESISGADVDELADALQLGREIAVGEHDAFGIAGGSRGVNDGRNIIWFTATGTKPGWAASTISSRKAALRAALPGSPSNRLPGSRLLSYRKAAFVGEEQGRATVFEQLSNLVCGKSSVRGTAVFPLATIPKNVATQLGLLKARIAQRVLPASPGTNAGTNQPFSDAIGKITKLLIRKALDGVAVGSGSDAGERRLQR